MKHFLFSITIALFSLTTACMEISEKRIPIKVADATISIPFSLVRQSAVLCTKQLWKKRLNIPYQKPIVVPHITSQQMALFAKAVSVSEDDFPSFYKQLSHTEQAELLHIAHENNLDSPYLTILLAQTVLPEDVTTSLIYPKTVHLEKIAHYFQTTALQHNIQKEEIPQRSSSTIFCDHTGIFKKIPSAEKDLHDLKMVYNITPSDAEMLIIKKHQQPLTKGLKQLDAATEPILSYKEIDNLTYFITVNNTESTSTVWQITDCPKGVLEYTYSEKNRQKQYNLVFITAIFSPNNKYILCLTNDVTKKALLLKLSNKKEEFITKELFLPDSLCVATLPQFNSSSTALALRSWQKAPLTSRVIFYNIKTKKNKIISSSMPHFIINQQWSPDGNKLAVLESDFDSFSQITIYDTTNLDIYNTIQLPSVITNITYTNNKDLVAVIKRGNLYFISENDDHSYNAQLIVQDYMKYKMLDSCLIFLPTRNIVCCYALEMPYILVWDLQTKTYLGEKAISSYMHKPIFKDTNESYLLTDNGSASWNKHILWSPEDNAAIEWIKKCPTLYKAYAIHRLYKAYKNGMPVKIKEKDPIFRAIIESFPEDVQLSLKEHFFKYPSLTESILKKGKDFCASLVSLFS